MRGIWATAAYLHPLAAATVVALLVYVASLGLRMRSARRGRAALARRHARLAPIAFALVAVSWAAGLASAAWLRPDLPAGDSLHLRLGALMVLLLSGSAITARRLARGDANARELHPWLGAAATLLAAGQVVSGLQLLP